MKRILFFLSLIVLSNKFYSQVEKSDVLYWSGSGTDSVVFVVDFNEQGVASSYSWGFLFDENSNITVQNMIESFISNGMDITANLNGGFLNDFTFLNHEGIGGTNSFYWATYSGSSFSNLTLSTGIQETLSNNMFVAFSFTDWETVSPYNPIQVIDLPTFYAGNTSVESINNNDFVVKTYENHYEIVGDFDYFNVFDINGKKLFSQDSNDNIINSDNLSSGLNFIELNKNGFNKTIKLLK